MSAPWFYLPSMLDVGEIATLDPRETRHATSSKRLAVGDRICLFDGTGVVADATLKQIDRKAATGLITNRRIIAPPHPHVHLAAALPKGDRQTVMLSMATQLGMSAFTPLQCERSVARATRSLTKRFSRICIESCKQSRRAVLPSLHEPVSPAEVVAAAKQRSEVCLFAQQGGDELSNVTGNNDEQFTVLIGPEGGFTEAEADQVLAEGGRSVHLGDGILRIETAAIAAISLLMLNAHSISEFP